MNEKPLERLNYFNGQRLQAADFKLEQDYHIRVRRWLNRSLYTPGIADGLQVYAIDNAPKVRVMPGLAIDMLGREIILLEEQDVDVVGQHNASGACSGPYLTIRYQEDILQQTTDYCVPCTRSANKPAELGPARILANPVLELNASLPDVSSGKIALACLSLAAGCGSIDFVDPGVRTYIGDVSASKVKQYALEGVRDLDANNPARIYFHIRGRQPNSVSLYLRSEQFPILYYTELGHHCHTNSAGGFSVTVPQHAHTIPQIGGNAGTGLAGGDTPSYQDIRGQVTGIITNPSPMAFTPFVWGGREASLQHWVGMKISFDPLPQHWHPIPSSTDAYAATTIPLSGSNSSSSAGVSDVAARNDTAGAPQRALTYVGDLQIAIDGHDVTEAARLQVVNNRPQSENWTKLGIGGGAADPMVTYGTGAIRIDYLPGVTLDENEHYIDLSVIGAGNGGRIHFNLYVE